MTHANPTNETWVSMGQIVRKAMFAMIGNAAKENII